MDYLLLFLAGLTSAPHCVGMCGGFVASCSLRWREARRGASSRFGLLRAHAAYHLGRLTTYGLLGALMGEAGSFVRAAGRLAGWQDLAAALAGALMIAWALARLRGRTLFEAPSLSPLRWPRARRLVRSLLAQPTLPSAVLLGSLLGFLPCGLLASMEIRAAGTGRPLAGLLTMLAFGLGTVPGLGAFGATSALAAARRERLDRLGALLVGLAGLLSLLRGLADSGLVPHLNPWLW